MSVDDSTFTEPSLVLFQDDQHGDAGFDIGADLSVHGFSFIST
jgi:hypothetical protein